MTFKMRMLSKKINIYWLNDIGEIIFYFFCLMKIQPRCESQNYYILEQGESLVAVI